jgi:uncharacterized membrane protein YagU involved in acid resistance
MLRPGTWLSALLGFGAMEGFFRAAPRVGLARIDYATMSGTYLLPPEKKASWVGHAMFFLGAVSLVSVFRSLRPRMKGPDWAEPLEFGVGLYLFSSAVIMPMLGVTNPRMRRGALKKPGFFGVGLNGWKTPVSNLIGHLIFSQVIGCRVLNRRY